MSSKYNKLMNKQEFLDKYGLELKVARVRHKMSQEQLAEKVDCSSVHIGYIERGLKCPTVYQFLKMARALDIDMNEFFKEF